MKIDNNNNVDRYAGNPSFKMRGNSSSRKALSELDALLTKSGVKQGVDELHIRYKKHKTPDAGDLCWGSGWPP